MAAAGRRDAAQIHAVPVGFAPRPPRAPRAGSATAEGQSGWRNGLHAVVQTKRKAHEGYLCARIHLALCFLAPRTHICYCALGGR